MSKYLPNRSYFAATQNAAHGSGISHGLAIMDVIEWLYRKTGDPAYLDFAQFLYKDFDNCQTNSDMAMKKLQWKYLPFIKHGPHIAEHFMIPFFLAATTGQEGYERLAGNAMAKLRYHSTPSAALVSYENVNADRGAANALYEYCSITELAISLIRVAQFTGMAEALDRVEMMTMNSGQGARLPVLTACSYLTSDNRRSIDSAAHGGREQYCASHSAAACCSLNAGRLMPYYVDGMWMKTADGRGLAATLYGPCRVRTEISGVRVAIEEDTGYPFSDEIILKVEPERAAEFGLLLRVPGFSEGIDLQGTEGALVAEQDGFIEIRKMWRSADVIRARLKNRVVKQPVYLSQSPKRDGICLQKGALLYSLPLPAKIEAVREHGNSGFYDYNVECTDPDGWEYRLDEEAEFEVRKNEVQDPENPWSESPICLRGDLRRPDGSKIELDLIPQGSTVLRRTGFLS